MSATFVRPATPADAPAMAGIRIAGWRSTYRGHVSDEVLEGFDQERETARMAELLASPPEYTQLVAETADGTVVGYCMFGPDRDYEGLPVGEVYAIYVEPELKGQGHGGALLDAAVTRLRAAGLGELHVWALVGNELASGFYQRCGWVRDDLERPLDTLPDIDGDPVREERFTLPAGRPSA